MKKFDAFLENIGLKNTATGERKPLGKIIGAILAIVLVIGAMILGNNLLKNSNTKKPTQDVALELEGTSTMVLYLNQEYVEPGYKATNEYGNDISNKVEVIGKVDTSVAGIYEISYRLSYKNETFAKRRTVTVIDKTKAVFTLLGESEKNIKKGETYVEDGYFLILPGESDPDKYVTITGSVDVNVPGIYRIIYKLDSPSLKHELIRTVNVIGESTLFPTITLVGGQSITLKINEKYKENGYSATDSVDGNITKKVSIKNDVKNGAPGLYEVKYTVKNSRGYETSISRIVKVLSKEESSTIIPTYGGIDEYIKIVPSNKAITKDNITLDITVINSSVKSIILPDNTITTSTNLRYTIKENGTYIIIVELNNGALITGSITINNIDREGPTGTCQAIYQNGKVSFAVNASDHEGTNEIAYDESKDYSACKKDVSFVPGYCYGDNMSSSSITDTASSGIAGYSYYNGEKYSEFVSKNTYEIATKKQFGYKVIIKDKIGNTTQIDCSEQRLSTTTAIKIVGETKAKLGDNVSLQVVFTPEYVENRKVTWEVIEGGSLGTINDAGVVTITSDGNNLKDKNNITIKATSNDGGLTATHTITVYANEKSLNESNSSSSDGSSSEGASWNGGTSAGLAEPSGIKLQVGEEVELNLSEYEKDNMKVTLLSTDYSIVMANGHKIKGLKVGNVKVRVSSGSTIFKEYDVSVVDSKCGASAQYMRQVYRIGEKNKQGNIIFGTAKSVPYDGIIVVGKNQVVKVTLTLPQKCGSIEYLTRTTADGEEGWRNYFEGYSKPYVNRYDKSTFIAKTKTYDWIISPKTTTNGKYITLSQTATQATSVFSEIKSFGKVRVKVVDENVSVGKIGSIIVGGGGNAHLFVKD